VKQRFKSCETCPYPTRLAPKVCSWEGNSSIPTIPGRRYNPSRSESKEIRERWELREKENPMFQTDPTEDASVVLWGFLFGLFLLAIAKGFELIDRLL
jgi:hypothetical protein